VKRVEEAATSDLLIHSLYFRLRCNAEGWPEPELSWYRDGEPLAEVGSSSSRQEVGTATLVLRQVTGRDSANYSCLAQNPVGSAAVVYTLQVHTYVLE
jgi:neural cell adhesion molecule